MLNIAVFVCNPFRERCMLVWDRGPGAVIVDPGFCRPEERDALYACVEREKLQPEAILLTHTHFDHVLGAAECAARFGIPAYLHPDDRARLQEYAAMAAPFQIPAAETDFPVRDVADGETLALAGMAFEVIHTPGHTPGGVCYYCRAAGDLFSGDTLFAGSIGRSDLPGGDYDREIVSIMEKLMPLPGETRVHPGHGGDTTIGAERAGNPVLQPFNEVDADGNVDGISIDG